MKKRYGSTSAINKRRKEYIKHKCHNCGKEFETRPSHKNRKYCSNKCRDDFRRHHNGELCQYYKHIEMKCSWCGKDIKIIPSRIRQGRAYCSKKCGMASRSKMWIDSLKKRAKHGCYSFGKRSALIRDNNKCLICGFDIVYDVHHIIKRADGGNNSLENIITLCPNHHAMAHRGLLSIDELKQYCIKANEKITIDEKHNRDENECKMVAKKIWHTRKQNELAKCIA